jgi:hypothetical protein
VSVEFRAYGASEIRDLPNLGRGQDCELKVEETDEETGEGFRVWYVPHARSYGLAPVFYECLVDGRWRKCDEHGNEL